MSEPVLLPCPFCGSRAVFGEVTDEDDDANFGGHFIACSGCIATTDLRFAGKEDPRPLLAEAWNTRSERAAAASALQRVAAALGVDCISDDGNDVFVDGPGDCPVADYVARIKAAAASQARREALDEIAFWRRDAAARLQMAVWLHRGCEQRGEEDRAADIRVGVLRPTLAALESADNREWHERCEICGEFLKPGDERASVSDGDEGTYDLHAKCAGEQTGLFVENDDAQVIAEAWAICDPDRALATPQESAS